MNILLLLKVYKSEWGNEWVAGYKLQTIISCDAYLIEMTKSFQVFFHIPSNLLILNSLTRSLTHSEVV